MLAINGGLFSDLKTTSYQVLDYQPEFSGAGHTMQLAFELTPTGGATAETFTVTISEHQTDMQALVAHIQDSLSRQLAASTSFTSVSVNASQDGFQWVDKMRIIDTHELTLTSNATTSP